MIKIGKIKFNSNLAVSIGGRKRENFKKGATIIVDSSEVLKLLRLGCTLVGEAVINYADHKKFIDDAVSEYEKVKEKEEKERQKAIEKEQKEYEKNLKKDAQAKEEAKIKLATDNFKAMIDTRTIGQLEYMVENLDEAVNTPQPIDTDEAKKYIQEVYDAKKQAEDTPEDENETPETPDVPENETPETPQNETPETPATPDAPEDAQSGEDSKDETGDGENKGEENETPKGDEGNAPKKTQK